MKRIYLIVFTVVLAIICVILMVDRVRLNLEMNKHGAKISEKNTQIERIRLASEDQLTEKQHEIDRLADKFQFVTEVRTPVLDKTQLNGKTENEKAEDASPEKAEERSSFLQKSEDPEIKKQAEKIVGSVGEPLPENVRNAFLKWQTERKIFPSQKLYVDAVSKRVIDRDAAILETACRMLNLNAATEIRWNMSGMARSCRTVITAADPSVPRAEIEYGNENFQRGPGVAVQSAAVTTVLDFPTVTVPDDGERRLLMEMHELPVGGLYVHRINVRRSATSKDAYWLLEYRIPDSLQEKWNASRETYLLRAFSLLPGPAVVSSVSGNRILFRVPFCEYSEDDAVHARSSLIVFGDNVFFPASVTIRSYSDREPLTF